MSEKNWAHYQAIASLLPEESIDSPPRSPCYRISKDDFVKLQRIPKKGSSAAEDMEKLMSEENRGFKFHVSVHPDDVPLAWDAIVELLQSKGVVSAKAVADKSLASWRREHRDEWSSRGVGANEQKGKMITLYIFPKRETAFDGKPLDWQPIINEIEEKLCQAGVRSGHEVSSDKPVKGSAYLSYRSDSLTDRIDALFAHMEDLINADDNGYERVMDSEALNQWYSTHDSEDGLGSPLCSSMPNFWKNAVYLEEARKMLPGFSAEELLLIKPQQEFESAREAIIRLPLEKRYKMPEEDDLLAAVHIVNPHSMQMLREKAIKGRGINTVS